jgi:BirA family transcriptional regulator, biotin operon repressor / biotin---[acetyl-CoA-carboxylase] ligase
MSMLDLQAVESAIVGTEFAGQILYLPLVGSTNVLALEAAQAGARSGVWVADEQTAGRGRGGHGWHSVAGDGLYVSALTSPPIPLTMANWLPLATGLAAQSAIAKVTELHADIRWPNDLLLNRRKCGGILVETASVAAKQDEPEMLRYAVIGVGINLNHMNFPAELESLATSLRREGGHMVSRDALLAALLCSLDEEIRLLVKQYRGTLNEAGLLERFATASSWVRGKRVHVEEGDGYTGVTAGLDARGFLQVAGDDGTLHTVLSGGVREQ